LRSRLVWTKLPTSIGLANFIMPNKPSKQKDKIELAKSIFDEIVEETESEDWNKEKKP
jgi:hypothetical protein